MSESAFGGPHPSRASLDPRRPICPVPPSESEKVAVDTQWEREMFKFRTAVEGTTIQRSEETGPEIMTAGFDRATIPKEQLDALRTHIKNDEPIRVADVLLYALPDVRAAPVAEVTIFDKKNREKVLGTEWHALGGRYKWRGPASPTRSTAPAVTISFPGVREDVAEAAKPVGDTRQIDSLSEPGHAAGGSARRARRAATARAPQGRGRRRRRGPDQGRQLRALRQLGGVPALLRLLQHPRGDAGPQGRRQRHAPAGPDARGRPARRRSGRRGGS